MTGGRALPLQRGALAVLAGVLACVAGATATSILGAADAPQAPPAGQTTTSVPVAPRSSSTQGSGSGKNAAPVEPLSPVQQFVQQAQAKIEAGTVSEADRAQGERLLAQATEVEVSALVLVMGRYQRLIVKQPIEALAVLGPPVIGKAKIDAWRAANAKAEKEALDAWRKASAKAKVERAPELPPKPEGPFVPFPLFAEWNVTESNCECALEMAQCRADLHDMPGAFEVVNFITGKFEYVPRILANECAGDLLSGSLRYEQAVGAYEFALRTDRATASYLGTASTKDEVAIRDRIRKKRDEARKQLELEKYGPGWVAYRDAEKMRRKQKRYLEAVLMYEDIQKDFPKTIWSEAATAYKIECLLELAKTGNAAIAEETIKGTERDLRMARLEAAGGINLSEERKAELPTLIPRLDRTIQRMRVLPKGENCAQEAERLAAAFLRQNEFGLYQGEVLVELAEYSFVQKLEPVEAQTRYARAWEWLVKVDGFDKVLGAFDVPSRAQMVSTPPKQEGVVDYFGNYKYADPEPGAVVNQNTCSWYLNSLRARCVLAQGFLEFSWGKNKEALGWYAQLEKFDGKTAFYAKQGLVNDFTRMKWGAEHGYLYAFPEELARFQGRQKFVVLMADFYFCTERFAEAKELYQRLLGGEFGQLADAAADFPQYGVAASTYYLGDRKKAYEEYLKVIAKRDGTFTETRATYCAANISAGIQDPAIQAKGMELMRDLAYSGQDGMFVYQAMIVYGERLVQAGKREDGYRVLRGVPKKANEYYELAQFHLNEYLAADKQGDKHE